MQETREHIAGEIRAALARKRVTQAELAKLMNITPMTLSRRMTGKAPFSAEELLIASRVLDIAYADIFPKDVPA